MAGALVLVGGLSACATGGGGGGGGCAPATPVIGGYPVVTPPTPGWFTSDTRTSANVEVSAAMPAPPGYGCNSVHLTTGANFQIGGVYQDKAQLFSYAEVGTPLSTINTISYLAYKSSASQASPVDVSLNVQVTGSTVPGSFATIVYEPYNQSGGNAGVLLDTWQSWNATATTPGDGRWWSTKIPSGPGSQANPQPWAFFQALYSDGLVGGYGFNVGSNNPNQDLAADALVFGTTTTDF
jgi:hypothetical protein